MIIEAHHWLALAAMGAFGAVGACASELTRMDRGNASWLGAFSGGLARSIVLGLAGAAAVPVLLSLAAAGSNDTLVTQVFFAGSCTAEAAARECSSLMHRLILLASFCAIAGFASRRVFETVTARLLNEVEAAREDSAEARRSAERTETAVMEVLEEPAAAGRAADARLAPADATSDPVLHALAWGRYPRRTAQGLARDTGLPETEVQARLDALAREGTVRKAQSLRDPNRVLWQAV